MSLEQIDPLRDPRWPAFLRRHPRASVFHSQGWLEALWRTYEYEPVVFTTSRPDAELTNGWVFCRIRSWLTGRRMVSLPFSDHCEPLVDRPEDLESMARAVQRDQEQQKWNYIEFRPCSVQPSAPTGFQPAQTFYLHKLDLHASIDQLFHNLHKDSTQRKIRRARREGLGYEEGRTESLLDRFYDLLLLTRQRHQLPPQPRSWFRNLIDGLGDLLKIGLVSKKDVPVAAILTLRYKDTLVYKYGCSDAKFLQFGGIHLLLWRAVQEAKSSGLVEFDLGRSDSDNEGLITFKNRWGATASKLNYYRCYLQKSRKADSGCEMWIAKRIFACMPKEILSTAGTLLYKHLG